MDKLQEYRKEIDEIDNDILSLFAKRFAVVKNIGAYKKDHNMPIINKEREKELIAILTQKANAQNLSSEFIEKIWQTIFGESYKIENNL